MLINTLGISTLAIRISTTVREARRLCRGLIDTNPSETRVLRDATVRINVASTPNLAKPLRRALDQLGPGRLRGGLVDADAGETRVSIAAVFVDAAGAVDIAPARVGVVFVFVVALLGGLRDANVVDTGAAFAVDVAVAVGVVGVAEDDTTRLSVKVAPFRR